MSKTAEQQVDGPTETVYTAPVHRPLDAVDGCVTEAADIIIVAVYRAGGGKHQAVTREIRDLEDHHFLPETAVHLQNNKRKHH